MMQMIGVLGDGENFFDENTIKNALKKALQNSILTTLSRINRSHPREKADELNMNVIFKQMVDQIGIKFNRPRK